MNDEQRSYLIAYDINDDVRRSHVAKVLQSHGERLQYSVFLLRIRPAQLLRLQSALEREIDGTSDSVLVCDVGLSSRTKRNLMFLGRRRYEDTVIPTVI